MPNNAVNLFIDIDYFGTTSTITNDMNYQPTPFCWLANSASWVEPLIVCT
jgi:hypothetical protein